MIDRQLCFNVAASGLLIQNAKSIGDGDRCKYRGLNGRKCAVGFLIPDEKYHPDMDDGNFDNRKLLEKFDCGPLLADPDNDDILFLTGLQKIHDMYMPGKWRGKLLEFAGIWQLDPDVLS